MLIQINLWTLWSVYLLEVACQVYNHLKTTQEYERLNLSRCFQISIMFYMLFSSDTNLQGDFQSNVAADYFAVTALSGLQWS